MDFDAEVYKSVFESLPVGVYLVDRQRRILGWNKGAEQLTGYLRQEVVGRSCAEDLLMHCDDSRTIVCGEACPLQSTLRDGQTRQVDLYLLHKDGQRIPVSVHSFALRNPDGDVVGCAECFETRVILPAAQRPRIAPGSLTRDELTELPDRGGALAWLSAALRDFEETGVRFGALRIAIDDLDGLLRKDGRNAVDAVLYATAQTLRANVSPADMAARWSGDSFLVAVMGCTAPALRRAAGILNRLTGSEAVPWWGDRLSVSVAMGGAIAAPGDTAESLAGRAEEALSRARAAEGNRIQVI